MRNHRHNRSDRQRRLSVEAIEERVLLSVAMQTNPSPIAAALAWTASGNPSASPAGAVYGVLTTAELQKGLLTLGTVLDANYELSAIGQFCSAGGSFSVSFAAQTLTITPIILNGNAAAGGSTSNGNATTIVIPPPKPLGPPLPPAGATGEQKPSDKPKETSAAPPITPAAPPRLRITYADPHSAGMLDTTPRPQEAVALALAKMAHTNHPLAAREDPHFAPHVEPVSASEQAEPPLSIKDATLGTPSRAAGAQPLDGSRGRSQAFDLAARDAERAPAEVRAAESLAEPVLLAEQSTAAPADTAVAADDTASRAAVFAQMDDSQTAFTPVRLDADHRVRSVLPLLAIVALAPELTGRGQLDPAAKTKLYPLRKRQT